MMHRQQQKALIIGCGIAGPALALFLKRAGIETEIYEARVTPEGFALSLSCNGLAVLAELGLERAVFAQGSAVTRWDMWSGKGRHLGEGVLSAGGLKSVFIKRVPLGNIISDQAERQGIRIVRGQKLEHIQATSQGDVIATFQDGSSATADLLIGADGVHSRTRQFVDPSFPGAVYTGLLNSGGYSSGLKLSSPPETIHFIFGKRAFFGYHVDPEGYIYWFVNWPQAEEPARDAFERITDAERKQQMLEMFDADQPLIQDIIGAAEETYPYFVSYALAKQPASWHKGAVLLLGDAAHAISPSSGQGASMALEDALALAKCLRDVADLEQTGVIFEQLRRARTEKMYEVGERGDAGKYVVEPLKQWFRDLTTPFFLKLFANPKASDWMYSYRIDWDEPIRAEPSALRRGQATVSSTDTTK